MKTLTIPVEYGIRKIVLSPSLDRSEGAGSWYLTMKTSRLVCGGVFREARAGHACCARRESSQTGCTLRVEHCDFGMCIVRIRTSSHHVV